MHAFDNYLLLKLILNFSIPQNQITKLNILDLKENINDKSFKNFSKLEEIQLSKYIKNIPKNEFNKCKKLSKIKCNPKLFINLSPEDKSNFQEVEFENIEEEIPENIFND